MWQPAAAFSLALLALFGALSFGLYRSLVNGDTPLLAIEESMGEFNPDKITEAIERNIKDDSNNSVMGGQPVVIVRNKVRQKSGISGQRIPRAEGFNPQSIDAAGLTVAKTTQADGTTEGAVPAQAVARMDIQTSDPNIRIIWLGRKPSE
jgi:hypothetical protein